MILDSVYRRLALANTPVTFNRFMKDLAMSSESEPITIWWTKEDGENTKREMYYGTYVGGEASDTRWANDMIALVSVDDGDEYRTVDLVTVSKYKWRGKFYIVK